MRNTERARRTRAALIDSAHRLFADLSYDEVSTEMVLAGAGVTRGALYHHFVDKAALFEAVCVVLSEGAMAAISSAVDGVEDPLLALEAGSHAWLDYMLGAEARRILLVEAPTVLGWSRWAALDEAHGFRLLFEGIETALAAGALRHDGEPLALAVIFNGAMNALALRVGPDNGGLDAAQARAAISALIRAFAASPETSASR